MRVEIMDVIRKRRSVRTFLPRELPEGTVEKLLEAAFWAPSGGNRQPWFFFVVRNPEIKGHLVDAAFGQSFLTEAPVVCVVCADPSRSGARYGVRGSSLYCIQDTAAAIQNMLLTATSMGLGTCWMGAFDESKVAEVIGCPEDLRPVAMIPIGYPAEDPKPPRRRNAADIVKVIS